MQTQDLPQAEQPPAVGRLSWRAMSRALRGDALAAFPEEAFEQPVVVQRFLGRQHVLLQSPDAIRHVLVENADNYTRMVAVRRVLRPMFGRGLFLSSGDAWRQQRRAVAPAFAPRGVHMLASRVVAAAEDLADELEAAGTDLVDLLPRLQQLALAIIGGAIFSLDMPRYGQELRSLIVDYALRLSRPSLADYLLPLAVPAPSDIARARFRRHWRRVISHIVMERTARPRGAAPSDLFDVLAAGDPEAGAGPDPETLGDQIATIIVAGHETTAAALFWALYLLARHPEVQGRVAAEIAEHGLTAGNAAAVLPHLTYTRAVIDEVLRLFPPAYVVVRQAVAHDVAGGVPLARGAVVLIAPWVLHRHRRLWPEPERFDPTRFMPGAPQPPRFAYMPFGSGPRTCVGAPFALTELVLVAGILVSAFDIGLASQVPVMPVGRVTLQPNAAPGFVLMPRAQRDRRIAERSRRYRQVARRVPGDVSA